MAFHCAPYFAVMVFGPDGGLYGTTQTETACTLTRDGVFVGRVDTVSLSRRCLWICATGSTLLLRSIKRETSTVPLNPAATWGAPPITGVESCSNSRQLRA